MNSNRENALKLKRNERHIEQSLLRANTIMVKTNKQIVSDHSESLALAKGFLRTLRDDIKRKQKKFEQAIRKFNPRKGNKDFKRCIALYGHMAPYISHPRVDLHKCDLFFQGYHIENDEDKFPMIMAEFYLLKLTRNGLQFECVPQLPRIVLTLHFIQRLIQRFHLRDFAEIKHICSVALLTLFIYTLENEVEMDEDICLDSFMYTNIKFAFRKTKRGFIIKSIIYLDDDQVAAYKKLLNTGLDIQRKGWTLPH